MSGKWCDIFQHNPRTCVLAETQCRPCSHRSSCVSRTGLVLGIRGDDRTQRITLIRSFVLPLNLCNCQFSLPSDCRQNWAENREEFISAPTPGKQLYSQPGYCRPIISLTASNFQGTPEMNLLNPISRTTKKSTTITAKPNSVTSDIASFSVILSFLSRHPSL